MRWNKKYPELAEITDFEYNNSERGFIVNHLAHLFKPSVLKKPRKKVWMPNMTKQDVWEALFLHIQHMKELYPKSDGRLCRYCHKSWTYQTRRKRRGAIKPKRRGSQHPTNFTIDRFNPRLTYLKGNIIFCCTGCNDRKHDSTSDDWNHFISVKNEVE